MINDKTVLVLGSQFLGEGEAQLGSILMKSFLYTLTQQEKIDAVLLYNSAAFLSCEGSEVLEDLTVLQEKGAKILTCGTCLGYYELKEKLLVGEVTNMYSIAETMREATTLLRP